MEQKLDRNNTISECNVVYMRLMKEIKSWLPGDVQLKRGVIHHCTIDFKWDLSLLLLASKLKKKKK